MVVRMAPGGHLRHRFQTSRAQIHCHSRSQGLVLRLFSRSTKTPKSPTRPTVLLASKLWPCKTQSFFRTFALAIQFGKNSSTKAWSLMPSARKWSVSAKRSLGPKAKAFFAASVSSLEGIP